MTNFAAPGVPLLAALSSFGICAPTFQTGRMKGVHAVVHRRLCNIHFLLTLILTAMDLSLRLAKRRLCAPFGGNSLASHFNLRQAR